MDPLLMPLADPEDPRCIECGEPEEMAWHLETAVECERSMREQSDGERGCANPDEHHAFRTSATS